MMKGEAERAGTVQVEMSRAGGVAVLAMCINT